MIILASPVWGFHQQNISSKVRQFFDSFNQIFLSAFSPIITLYLASNYQCPIKMMMLLNLDCNNSGVRWNLGKICVVDPQMVIRVGQNNHIQKIIGPIHTLYELGVDVRCVDKICSATNNQKLLPLKFKFKLYK